IAAIVSMLYLMAQPDRPAVFYALSLAIFPAIILLSLRSKAVASVLRARPVIHLGHISFSVYLLHYPLELLYRDAMALTGIRPDFDNPIVLALVVATCLGASHYTWKYFEVPARRWVRKRLG
ncbi:MAG TPA: hypothetical protein PLJ47_04695, partial [Candidatus Hydrogenedentes bacterium]|nr:hypothetical protein [Candidatus Hydrogenedentota bacterium]